MNDDLIPSPILTNRRLLFLGAASLALCSVSFIMCIFAPFPLALAIVLYGKKKGYLVSLLGLSLSYLLAQFVFQDSTLFVFYFIVVVFGIGLAHIVQKSMPPVKGLVQLGLGFIVSVFLLLSAALISLKQTPQEFIIQQIEQNADKISEQKKLLEKSGGENVIEVLQILDRPDLMAKEIVEVFPSYFFIGVFIMLWFNTFLLLKSRRLLFLGFEFEHSEKDLLNFTVPFPVVGLLAIGLILALVGQTLAPVYEVVGFTLIWCLGIFYFFQGFGVLNEFLNFLKMKGFFRSLIVMSVLFMASYLVAAVGLFDNWFNFRKYLIKK